MTTKGKALLAVLGAVIVSWAIYGAYQYPLAVGSPAGSTFSNAKFAGATASLATPGANGTSTSILNTDSSDRYITSLVAACSGVGTSRVAYTGGGLAALLITAATTSTAAPSSLPSGYNTILGAAITMPTSTPASGVASSTMGTGMSTTTLIWAANSYLTFQTNATNTAACTFGAHYVGS